MDTSFGNDVRVQSIAQVDGVDIVAAMMSVLCVDDATRTKGDGLSSNRRCRTTTPWIQVPHSPFQVAVHDGEEDLQEEIDRIDKDRKQVQPCLAGHCAVWDGSLWETTVSLPMLPRLRPVMLGCLRSSLVAPDCVLSISLVDSCLRAG